MCPAPPPPQKKKRKKRGGAELSLFQISSSPLVGSIGVSERCARAPCRRASLTVYGVATLLPVAVERRFDSRQGGDEFLAEQTWISVSERLRGPKHVAPLLTAPVTGCGNASDGSL